eukprot:5516783-Prymnesium_polylepis.1
MSRTSMNAPRAQRCSRASERHSCTAFTVNSDFVNARRSFEWREVSVRVFRAVLGVTGQVCGVRARLRLQHVWLSPASSSGPKPAQV